MAKSSMETDNQLCIKGKPHTTHEKEKNSNIIAEIDKLVL